MCRTDYHCTFIPSALINAALSSSEKMLSVISGVYKDLTEVEGHRRVVVCFAVSDEVYLVLPLLLLQSVFGAAMVAHAAAAQDEDDRPH